MGLLKDEDKELLKKLFEGLKDEVKIVMFTRQAECPLCQTTREMVEEVVSFSDKIKAEIKDIERDAKEAEQFGVDKTPALILMGEKDLGIRFYGIPAGYEFTSFIEDILSVSLGLHGLSQEVLDELGKVDKPVHLQVFVSPACPYCSTAVRTAHKFAMASEHITADMVEASEFPDLVKKYEVQGVPNTIINESTSLVGAAPELDVAKKILEALGK